MRFDWCQMNFSPNYAVRLYYLLFYYVNKNFVSLPQESLIIQSIIISVVEQIAYRHTV